MKYFNTLPKILTSDSKGNDIILTNLLARSSIIPSILNDVSLYYEYDVQGGETPEIVAYKYYGSTEDFWVVLFSNQILDPQWDWPLSGQNFDDYIISKYGSLSNATSRISHYEEKITTTISDTVEPPEIEIYVIDETAYNLPGPPEKTFTLPSGFIVSVLTEKRIVSVYEKELDLNESKRKIRLLNKNYTSIIEQELRTLMGQ
jgi:hypothetical protein